MAKVAAISFTTRLTSSPRQRIFLKNYGWRRGEPWGEGTTNMEAIRAWNKSIIYSKTIAYFAERLAAPN